MHDEGYIVGDIITNNFDGLTIRVGLKEKYLRRYDLEKFYPDIEFASNVKILITIGTHADRRRVLQSAREKGLKIIHIDTEGFCEDDKFIKYPKEGIKKEDLIYHRTADDAIEELMNLLKL